MTVIAKKSLTYVEIDIDRCRLTYSIAPCEAVLGETGDHKCFNSLKTCQDRDNYEGETVTLRFAVDCDYRPPEIEAIPSIIDAQVTPAVLSLGKDLGQRATLTVKFRDHQHSDTGVGFDK